VVALTKDECVLAIADTSYWDIVFKEYIGDWIPDVFSEITYRPNGYWEVDDLGRISASVVLSKCMIDSGVYKRASRITTPMEPHSDALWVTLNC
ncbi:MAG: hypothetical protein KGD60_04650, partial [Candidatus Thorarchaeota archaeon]|nr:hypothetical protein [Candidatus Thorarchaeota archaeon]